MRVRGWDPIGDLLSLQERVNRLFEQTLAPERLEAPLLGGGVWAPPADACETESAYLIQIELPGVNEDEVELQIDSEQLLVRGQRRDWQDERPETFHRMERARGPFARMFRFPSLVDPDGMRAQFRDGLLSLEVRKLSPTDRRGGRGA